MPLYPYVCDRCEGSFEEFQRMNDPPVSECPFCGEAPRRIFGLPNAVCRGVENAKTLGQAAEENTRRLVGKLGVEGAKEHLHERTYGGGGQLKLGQGMSNAGRALHSERAETPWWRSGEIAGLERSEKPLDLSKIKNAEKYVATGDAT